MNCTKQEFELIVKICERAEEMKIAPAERMTLIMDLDNTHRSVGLNLEGLLAADDLNFAHDIVGIQNHINRETKELEDFFVPRYARQNVEELIDKATARSELTINDNDGIGVNKNNIER